MSQKHVRSTANRVGQESGRQLRSLHERGVLESVDGTTTTTRRRPGELKVADGVRIVKDGAVVLDELGQGCGGRSVQLCIHGEAGGVQHGGRWGLRAGDGCGEWSHGVDCNSCLFEAEVSRFAQKC